MDIAVCVKQVPDSHAPIMHEADYAVVGDLVKVLPVLTKQLKKP